MDASSSSQLPDKIGSTCCQGKSKSTVQSKGQTTLLPPCLGFLSLSTFFYCACAFFPPFLFVHPIVRDRYTIVRDVYRYRYCRYTVYFSDRYIFSCHPWDAGLLVRIIGDYAPSPGTVERNNRYFRDNIAMSATLNSRRT